MPDILDKYFVVTPKADSVECAHDARFPTTQEGRRQAKVLARQLANETMKQHYVLRVYEHE